MTERNGHVRLVEPVADPEEEWLAMALVAAFTTFLRIARKRLGLKHGERCPKCGHSF